jgi:hypothetical protein
METASTSKEHAAIFGESDSIDHGGGRTPNSKSQRRRLPAPSETSAPRKNAPSEFKIFPPGDCQEDLHRFIEAISIQRGSQSATCTKKNNSPSSRTPRLRRDSSSSSDVFGDPVASPQDEEAAACPHAKLAGQHLAAYARHKQGLSIFGLGYRRSVSADCALHRPDFRSPRGRQPSEGKSNCLAGSRTSTLPAWPKKWRKMISRKFKAKGGL